MSFAKTDLHNDPLDDWIAAAFPGRDGASTFFRPSPAATSGPAPGLAVGKLVGEFRLIKLLGQGGMGQVWSAAQVTLGDRLVAIKFVLPERVAARELEYFAREARAGGRIRHPGIVTILGRGESDGSAWIAMELVDGGATLRGAIDDFARLPLQARDHERRVAQLVAEIADAVQAAHEAGVIHRDLKPQNVLIARDGSPKVGDFGLARIVDESALSHSGDVVGSCYYMSPEQVGGKRSRVDHRTDVFSLGVILYELLTLRRPFEGETAHQVAARILAVEPTDPRRIRPQIARDLAVIVGKALEKRSERRYSSMHELAAELRRFLSHEPILAVPPTRAERALKWVQRHPAKSVFAIAVVLLTAVSVWSGVTVARAGATIAAAEWIERRTRLIDDLNTAFESRTDGTMGSNPDPAREWRVCADVLQAHQLAPDRAFATRLGDFIRDAPEPHMARDVLDQLYRVALPLTRMARDDTAWQNAPDMMAALHNIDAAFQEVETDAWRRAVWERLWRPLVDVDCEALAPRDTWATRSAADLEWAGLQFRGVAAKEFSRDLLRAAYAKDPTRFQVNLALGTATSGWERRLHSYSAVALRPTSGHAHYNVAWNAQNLFNEKETAVRHYRIAINCNPRLARAYNNLAQLLPDAEALSLLEDAHQIVEPDQIFFARHANLLHWAKRWTEAIAVCEKGLTHFPDHAFLYEELGNCFMKTEATAAAIACFERCVTLNPKSWVAWFNMSELLAQQAREVPEDEVESADLARRACDAAERAWSLNPRDPQTLVLLGASYATNRDWDRAVPLLVSAAERCEPAAIDELVSCLPALRADPRYAGLAVSAGDTVAKLRRR